MKKHGVTIEYSKIVPQIYLGTNACCKLHFKRELINNGIKADISMEEERIDAAWGVDYFLWLPTRDHMAPKQHQLMLGC